MSKYLLLSIPIVVTSVAALVVQRQARTENLENLVLEGESTHPIVEALRVGMATNSIGSVNTATRNTISVNAQVNTVTRNTISVNAQVNTVTRNTISVNAQVNTVTRNTISVNAQVSNLASNAFLQHSLNAKGLVQLFPTGTKLPQPIISSQNVQSKQVL